MLRGGEVVSAKMSVTERRIAGDCFDEHKNFRRIRLECEGLLC